MSRVLLALALGAVCAGLAGCEGATLTRTVEQDGYTLRTVTTGAEGARQGEVVLLARSAGMQPSGMIGSNTGATVGAGMAVRVATASGVQRLLAGFSGPSTIRVCAEAQQATVQPSVEIGGRTYTVERQCPAGEE